MKMNGILKFYMKFIHEDNYTLIRTFYILTYTILNTIIQNYLFLSIKMLRVILRIIFSSFYVYTRNFKTTILKNTFTFERLKRKKRNVNYLCFDRSRRNRSWKKFHGLNRSLVRISIQHAV